MSAARFISVGEAGYLVGRSPATIRRWDRNGMLPNTRRGPGARRLILLADVRAIVNGKAGVRSEQR